MRMVEVQFTYETVHLTHAVHRYTVVLEGSVEWCQLVNGKPRGGRPRPPAYLLCRTWPGSLTWGNAPPSAASPVKFGIGQIC